jgi:hypothetical protein
MCLYPAAAALLTRIAEAADSKAVDPLSPLAASLGYVHDASKVDVEKFPKKKGPDGAKQLCSTCQLYLGGNSKITGEEGEWGKCAIFPDGLVNVNGWCNSWALKAT